MLTTHSASKLLNQLDGITLKEHFGAEAFCANGRMFATLWTEKKEVNLRLSRSEQQKFLLLDGEGFVEIHNAWGKQGWTRCQLEFVDSKDFEAAIQSAWKHSEVPTSKAKRVKPRQKKRKKK